MYAVLVEQLEQSIRSERQVAATLAAAGFDVQIPSMIEARKAFDAALIAEPEGAEVVDFEQAQLRRALGVA